MPYGTVMHIGKAKFIINVKKRNSGAVSWMVSFSQSMKNAISKIIFINLNDIFLKLYFYYIEIFLELYL